MITEVAIDLDGVMYPFAQEFQKYCSKALNRDNLPPAIRWHFYEDWGLSTPEYLALLEEATHAGVFLHGEPPAGAMAAWQMLRNMGIKIHIMTARSSDAYADTTWWLDHWLLKADSLHFTNDKWIFSHLMQAQDKMGAMLEDSPEHLLSLAPLANVLPVAFHQPWNAHVPCPRVENLMEFARLIDRYNRR